MLQRNRPLSDPTSNLDAPRDVSAPSQPAAGNQWWGFTLRRADLRSADVFVEYHGKEIGAADVSRFLPNWRSLKWSQFPEVSCHARHARN